MTFSRLVWMVDNLLFFAYWFLDEVRSIKEVQKTSGPFWIYISIFTRPIRFIRGLAGLWVVSSFTANEIEYLFIWTELLYVNLRSAKTYVFDCKVENNSKVENMWEVTTSISLW